MTTYSITWKNVNIRQLASLARMGIGSNNDDLGMFPEPVVTIHNDVTPSSDKSISSRQDDVVGALKNVAEECERMCQKSSLALERGETWRKRADDLHHMICVGDMTYVGTVLSIWKRELKTLQGTCDFSDDVAQVALDAVAMLDSKIR